MKERIISAVVALLIAIPLFLLGGLYFEIFIFILALLGLRELMNAKDNIPKYLKYISYLLLVLFLVNSFNVTDLGFFINIKYIVLLILVLVIPILIYNNNDTYNIEDAFYLMSSIIFLYIAFTSLILVRNENLMLAIYLVTLPMITDIFAYFGGIKFGKHKLNKSFSPNKSIEGVVIGTVFGTICSSAIYYYLVNMDIAIIKIVLLSLILVIIGQFGDLLFSSIKRHFKIKDFSNIMPGHGGILDRFDSIIFVLLGYIFIISIL